MAPPRAHARREQGVEQPAARLGVGLEHAHVDVAVARVPAPGHERPVLGGELATRAMYAGIEARGTTTSIMSSAPLALATQNAFSRASTSAGGRRGGST